LSASLIERGTDRHTHSSLIGFRSVKAAPFTNKKNPSSRLLSWNSINKRPSPLCHWRLRNEQV